MKVYIIGKTGFFRHYDVDWDKGQSQAILETGYRDEETGFLYLVTEDAIIYEEQKHARHKHRPCIIYYENDPRPISPKHVHLLGLSAEDLFVAVNDNLIHDLEVGEKVTVPLQKKIETWDSKLTWILIIAGVAALSGIAGAIVAFRSSGGAEVLDSATKQLGL